jgi:hypothetical protein
MNLYFKFINDSKWYHRNIRPTAISLKTIADAKIMYNRPEVVEKLKNHYNIVVFHTADDGFFVLLDNTDSFKIEEMTFVILEATSAEDIVA